MIIVQIYLKKFWADENKQFKLRKIFYPDFNFPTLYFWLKRLFVSN